MYESEVLEEMKTSAYIDLEAVCRPLAQSTSGFTDMHKQLYMCEIPRVAKLFRRMYSRRSKSIFIPMTEGLEYWNTDHRVIHNN